jgi:hypothetical protein
MYVEPPVGQAVRTTLKQHGVVYLAGPEGAGRFTTACAELTDLCGADKIVMIDLDEGARVRKVLDDDVLREGTGHILELAKDQVVTKPTLATLGSRAKEVGGYVVVVAAPSRQMDRSLWPYAVWHLSPPAQEVLAQHLKKMLDDKDFCVGSCGECTRECYAPYVKAVLSDDAIARHLAVGPPPREVVNLASRLLTVHQEGGKPADALRLLYSKIREVAVEVLGKQDSTPLTFSQSRQLLRRTAFRIAYAVFNGCPLSVVFDTAPALFAALTVVQRPDQVPVAGAVFDGKVNDLLHSDMTAEDPGREGEPDRTVRLIDPLLTEAMLDVLWNGYDPVPGTNDPVGVPARPARTGTGPPPRRRHRRDSGSVRRDAGVSRSAQIVGD